jgi:mutator protein MutT
MIEVAAAIIMKGGRYLICRRGEGGSCAHLWEFPGGKRERGETPEECLWRECREELGVDIHIRTVFEKTTYRYPDREIAFTFFLADIIAGDITPTVHEAVRWVLPSELKNFKFCPADVGIVNLLNA